MGGDDGASRRRDVGTSGSRETSRPLRWPRRRNVGVLRRRLSRRGVEMSRRRDNRRRDDDALSGRNVESSEPPDFETSRPVRRRGVEASRCRSFEASRRRVGDCRQTTEEPTETRMGMRPVFLD